MEDLKVDLSYDQLPSQKYLHDSLATKKAYLGGFGSGKTHWLCMETIRYAMESPKNYILLLRRTYPELDDTLIESFFEVCPQEIIAPRGWKSTKRNLTLVNGTKIAFRSFDTLGKISNYNLGDFGLSQAEEIPEAYFLALIGRLRRVNIKHHHALLEANPAGKNWIWRRWIRDNKDNPDYAHVTAHTEENTFLPPDYVSTLKSMFPEQWIKRYMNCGFDEFEGLVFDKFKDKDIIIELPDQPCDMAYNIVVIDIGVNNPTGVLFGYFNVEKQRLVLYDQIYERGMTIRQISNLIKARLHKWKLTKVWKYLIDPDALKRKQGENRITTAAQDFRTNGIPIIKADNNVDYGILRTNELFDRGIIKVLNSLNHFLDEIYDFIFKPKKGVDTGEINSPGKPLTRRDHLMGCLRYMVLSIPLSWTKGEAGEGEENIWEKHFANRFNKIKRGKSMIKDVRRYSDSERAISRRTRNRIFERRRMPVC